MGSATSFGKVLRQLRIKACMTQEQLGFEANLRRTYISILELGQQQPTLTTILKISSALGVRAGDLVNQVEEDIDRDGEIQRND